MILISLTSIHSRVSTLHQVIQSILIQKVEYSFIINLYLSKEGYMLDEGINNLPKELKELEEKNENFTIFYTKNIGSYRKFIPAMQSLIDGSLYFKYLVTVDDDTVYPSNWLSELVNGIQTYKCVTGYRGRRIRLNSYGIAKYNEWLHSDESLLLPNLKTVATGKDGVIYEPSFFHPDVMDYKMALEICGHADDLWLKVNTMILGVPTVLLKHKLSDEFKDLGTEDENTLYKKFNKSGGNDIAMMNIVDFYRTKYGLSLLDVISGNISSNSTWLSTKFIQSL